MQDMSKAFFLPLAEGYLPPSIQAIMAGGRLVALLKPPKKGIRPICIGNAWLRLLGRGFLKDVNKTIVDFLQNSNPNVIQFIGTKDGAANMFHLVTGMEEVALTLNAQAGQEVQAQVLSWWWRWMPRMHSTLSRERLSGASSRPTWVEQGLSGAESSVGAVVEVC